MSRAGLPQRLLYRTRTGAVLLRLLTAPRLSKWAGRFCDSPLSKGLIRPFARRNQVDVGACRRRVFWSFNDFFTRQLPPGARPFAQMPGCLQSPADGCVSAYRIGPSSRFCIKRIEYSLEALLRDPALARRYEGGACCILRLAPAHYHRFAYVDGGIKGKNVRIEGRLHTVRPIAYERHAVPVENTREYCVISTEQFGQVVQMEVGAMLVGRIVNYRTGAGRVERGEEKGLFEFGGSTVLLLLEPGRAELRPRFFAETARGNEVFVRMGETIGSALLQDGVQSPKVPWATRGDAAENTDQSETIRASNLPKLAKTR